jgi:hypothetical protein
VGKHGYRPSLQNAALHRQRTEPQELHPNYNSSGEAEVVPGFQLAAEIRQFQRWWELEYPEDGLNFNEANIFIGPLQFIEQESQRCACKVGVKYLSDILRGERLTVGYCKAEAILMALGKEHLLKTGEIQVVPNPNWSFEKWVNYMQERGCI